MRLGRKLLAIGGLMLLLLVPLALLDGLVYERQQRAAEVVADIAQASANEQRVTAPLPRLSELARHGARLANGLPLEARELAIQASGTALFAAAALPLALAVFERKDF